MNAGEKVSRKLVVAGGDGTKVLEFIEEALDQIALAIKREVARRWRRTVGFRRDHRGDFALSKTVAERISIVRLVADQGFRIDPFEQRFCAGQIVGLPRREHDIDGIAERIDQHMNFGGQSAAGSADRLFAVFFRAPALCWWARTMVASIIMYSLS